MSQELSPNERDDLARFAAERAPEGFHGFALVAKDPDGAVTVIAWNKDVEVLEAARRAEVCTRAIHIVPVVSRAA